MKLSALVFADAVRAFLHDFAIIQLLLGFISGFRAYLTEARHRCCCSTLKRFLLLYNPSASNQYPLCLSKEHPGLSACPYSLPPIPIFPLLTLRSLTFFVDVAASQASYLTKRKVLFSGLTKLNGLRLTGWVTKYVIVPTVVILQQVQKYSVVFL